MRIPPGTLPSPGAWQHPATYSVLEHAADPDGLVDAALRRVAPWAGGTVVDVGCGTGPHLPAYAAAAASVVGVEPHPRLAAAARRRVAELPGVRVVEATSQRLPLADRSADTVHARWAYFFGPGCEPGLREAFRVLRRGGTLAVVDVDATGDGYARWFRESWPRRDPAAADAFFARLGFARAALPVRWVFSGRADLESVLRIEFPSPVAERASRQTAGLELSVPTVLRWRRAEL